MPPILFPSSTAPGHDLIEGSGRLINCYVERLQAGSPAKAGYVIRRAPGLTVFCTTSETGFRGSWYDGNAYIYAAWQDELFYIDSAGTETSVGALLSARLTFLTGLTDSTNLTTYTYAAVAIGTAHFNRRIVVSVFFDAADDSPPVAVTIGGVAATLVKNQNNAVAIYIALVPTGTTANIVVQYATAANRSAIGAWRLDGVTSNTPFFTNGSTDTSGGSSFVTAGVPIPPGGVAIASGTLSTTGLPNWTFGDFAQDFASVVEASKVHSGASIVSTLPGGKYATFVYVAATVDLAVASWGGPSGVADAVTFAKNNKSPTPDQVLVTPTLGAFTFTTSAITVLDVNSEIPNSVCFGEGYFFFSAGGLCYASNLNSTTVTSTDVIRFESKPESIVRVLFFSGELYLFGSTCVEVWASGGNPNTSGFPFNRTTVFWRGLVGIHAITGWEDGFHANLIWVADDASVRMLVGYDPVQISTPDLERAIAAVPDKSLIRAFCYDVDGHASIVIDLASTTTWIYDINEKTWHERKSDTIDYWRATGNTVKAFDKWLVGDYLTGNLYQIDPASKVDGAENTISFIAESIEMEAFPQRLGISRADFNFVTGVGDATTRDPDVFVSWSDDGGHTWSDPVTKKLGEAGRYFDEIRLNRVGLTGRKGRRWRVRVDDPVYVGLLGGDMVVSGRP